MCLFAYASSRLVKTRETPKAKWSLCPLGRHNKSLSLVNFRQLCLHERTTHVYMWHSLWGGRWVTEALGDQPPLISMMCGRTASVVGDLGKPGLRRTKASSSKTHALPENARAPRIHLRKQTYFTFIENTSTGGKACKLSPLTHMFTCIDALFCGPAWHSQTPNKVCVCLSQPLGPPSKSFTGLS